MVANIVKAISIYCLIWFPFLVAFFIWFLWTPYKSIWKNIGVGLLYGTGVVAIVFILLFIFFNSILIN